MPLRLVNKAACHFSISSQGIVWAFFTQRLLSFREPLNNSLCPVSTRCISRNLHLVKVISVKNGHYFSAFLLLFLKKGNEWKFGMKCHIGVYLLIPYSRLISFWLLPAAI